MRLAIAGLVVGMLPVAAMSARRSHEQGSSALQAGVYEIGPGNLIGAFE